jgi:serine/threonine protein phosphatase 1
VKRHIVIGDIHGCYAELMDLLDRIGLRDEDQVISVGDAVDRGPDTPRVIEFFRNRPGSVVLVGNHERKHIRRVLSYSQRITRLQLGEHYPGAVSWMDSLPYFYETEEAIIVHAGLQPGLPLEQQRPEILCGSTSGERALRRQFGERPWFEFFKGPKPIIFGHKVFPEGSLRKSGLVYGIDTGACRGGALTSVILPAFEIVSVKARANHWGRIAAEFQGRVLRGGNWQVLHWDALDDAVTVREMLGEETTPEAAAELERCLALARRLPSRLVEITEREYARLDVGTDIRAFAPAAKRHPLEWLLFLRRRTQVTENDVRRLFSTPAAALAALEKLGQAPVELVAAVRAGPAEDEED